LVFDWKKAAIIRVVAPVQSGSYIIENDWFSTGKKLPSSGWLPPVQSGSKKEWVKAPKFGGGKKAAV